MITVVVVFVEEEWRMEGKEQEKEYFDADKQIEQMEHMK